MDNSPKNNTIIKIKCTCNDSCNNFLSFWSFFLIRIVFEGTTDIKLYLISWHPCSLSLAFEIRSEITDFAFSNQCVPFYGYEFYNLDILRSSIRGQFFLKFRKTFRKRLKFLQKKVQEKLLSCPVSPWFIGHDLRPSNSYKFDSCGM